MWWGARYVCPCRLRRFDWFDWFDPVSRGVPIGLTYLSAYKLAPQNYLWYRFIVMDVDTDLSISVTPFSGGKLGLGLFCCMCTSKFADRSDLTINHHTEITDPDVYVGFNPKPTKDDHVFAARGFGAGASRDGVNGHIHICTSGSTNPRTHTHSDVPHTHTKPQNTQTRSPSSRPHSRSTARPTPRSASAVISASVSTAGATRASRSSPRSTAGGRAPWA